MPTSQHFPRRYLAGLSDHLVKVLHLHEHILLSSLNIALYICVNLLLVPAVRIYTLVHLLCE